MCLLFIQTIFCPRHQWLFHSPFSIFKKHPLFAIFLPWKLGRTKGKCLVSVLQRTPRHTKQTNNSLGTSSTLVLEPGTDGVGRWEWREIQTAIFKTGITPRSRVGQGKFKCHNKALLLYLSLFLIQHSVDYYNPLIISQSSDNLLWQFLLSLVGFLWRHRLLEPP